MGRSAPAVALVRRWPVVLVGLMLTMGMVLGLGKAVGPTYQATAAVLMVPSKTTIPQGGNPLLYIGGLDQAGSVLALSMNTDEKKSRVLGEPSSIDYAVTPGAGAAVLQVTVSGPNPNSVSTMRDNVLTVMGDEFNQLQDRALAPQEARIRLVTLASSDEPQVNSKTVMRLQIAALLAGIGGTLGLALLLDAGMAAVSGRRASLRPAGASAVPGTSGEGGLIPERVPESATLRIERDVGQPESVSYR